MLNRLLRHPLVVAGLAVFVGLSIMVVADITLPWDEAILRWAGRERSAGLTEFMLAVTFLGDGALEVPLRLWL